MRLADAARAMQQKPGTIKNGVLLYEPSRRTEGKRKRIVHVSCELDGEIVEAAVGETLGYPRADQPAMQHRIFAAGTRYHSRCGPALDRLRTPSAAAALLTHEFDRRYSGSHWFQHSE